MALSPPSGVIISYDDGGGTPVDISQFVLTINDVDVESITEETHPFSTSWEAHKPVGLGRMSPVTIGGLYDDVAAGPNALFAGRVPESPSVATRTLTITWRSGKTTSVETYLQLYKRTADRAALTKWAATLLPTGTVTEV